MRLLGATVPVEPAQVRQFSAERGPIGSVALTFERLFARESLVDGRDVPVDGGADCRAIVCDSEGEFGECRRAFDEQLGRPKLAEPEAGVRVICPFTELEIVRLYEPPDHGPVFVVLGLLGGNEVGQGEDVDVEDITLPGGPRRKQAHRRAARPQAGKGIDPAHSGHDIDSYSPHVLPVAAKVDGVPTVEVSGLERRHGDHSRVQRLEPALEALEIPSVGDDREIDVPAKLRGAVQDAGLAAIRRLCMACVRIVERTL